jgi:DNA replication protein DnaC
MDTWSGAEQQEQPSPKSVCPVCKGAGFIHPRLASGKPDFSRVTACRCAKEESDKERQSRLLRDSGLDLPLLKSMTFDNFDWKRVNLPPEQRENLAWVFDVVHKWAESPDGWLVLTGVTGCGKTHLAVAIAKYQLQTGRPVKFVVVPDLLDHLRSTFSPESKVSYDQLFEEVKNTPLLILDDFGEHATTLWAKEKLYQVINYRYNARLPTVITTRCSLDEIDEPISSRFLDGKNSMVININVPDYRESRAQKAKTPRHTKRER